MISICSLQSTMPQWAVSVIMSAIAFSYSALSSAASATGADRPNILWITSEDNGISWVSCYGGTNAKTPAIDQLATDGCRFTQFYAGSPVAAGSQWDHAVIRSDYQTHASNFFA